MYFVTPPADILAYIAVISVTAGTISIYLLGTNQTRYYEVNTFPSILRAVITARSAVFSCEMDKPKGSPQIFPTCNDTSE